MKKFFEKNPIFCYVMGSFIKFFLIMGSVFAVVFVILKTSGIYSGLETVLNLKYNSPLILIPMYGFAVLAVLSLVIGFLMYFHKYKRTRNKSKFYYIFKSIINKADEEMER